MSDRMIELVEEWLGRYGFNADMHRKEYAPIFLATRIPWLCADCENGFVIVPEDHDVPEGATVMRLKPCDHPNAPTVGDLLAAGEAVAPCVGDFIRLERNEGLYTWDDRQVYVAAEAVVLIAVPLADYQRHLIDLDGRMLRGDSSVAFRHGSASTGGSDE